MATREVSSARSDAGLTQRLLDGVERVGNKVPHPVLMFLYLIILVIVFSHVLYLLDVSVTEQIAEPVSIAVQPDYYEDTSEPSLRDPCRRAAVRDQPADGRHSKPVDGRRHPLHLHAVRGELSGLRGHGGHLHCLAGCGSGGTSRADGGAHPQTGAGGAATVVHLHPGVRWRPGQHRRRRGISDPRPARRGRLPQPGTASAGRHGRGIRRRRRHLHGEPPHHPDRQHAERDHQRSDRGSSAARRCHSPRIYTSRRPRRWSWP